jgi:hypothetical protein
MVCPSATAPNLATSAKKLPDGLVRAPTVLIQSGSSFAEIFDKTNVKKTIKGILKNSILIY